MGKGGDNKSSPRDQVEQPVWVKVNDRLYDVKNFAKRHPGGNVINYSLHKDGADATDTFMEFHFRSEKAQKQLKSLPNRPVEESDARCPSQGSLKDEDAMLADFRIFRQKLVDDGYFTPKPGHVAYRIAEVAGMFALSLYLLQGGHFYSSLAGLILIGLFGGRCGWIQHEGGHNSLTGNIFVDKQLQAFFIGFGLSSSASMWNAMHQKHHATPQKIKHDLDIDTTPLVAFFNDALTKNRNAGTPYSALWLRFQALTFVPVTSGMVVMLFWLFYLHPRKVIKAKKWNEAFWMVSSHIVITYLIAQTTGMSTGSAYAAFWFTRWIGGMYLFGNFSLSHTHCDVIDADEHRNWVEYAVHHTVDIEPGTFWVDWWMGYLNCQVIHHLFPSMPQTNQPEVSKLFEKFCDKWDLKYTNVSYWEAWRLTLQNLEDVGQHIHKATAEGKIGKKLK
jgi:fatty acid desaturase